LSYEDKDVEWRITPGKEPLMNPKESEKTMEEYEYLTADSAENCKTIAEWIFAREAEVGQFCQSELVFCETIALVLGKAYRRRKPAPPKVKKLVDRTAEELIPLIGYIARKKRDGLYFMITSNQVFDQENMEIAPLGSDDFLPMQKEIEVVG
jgi:hypothetical protein